MAALPTRPKRRYAATLGAGRCLFYEEADLLRVQSAFNKQGRKMAQDRTEGRGIGRAQPLLNYMPVGEDGVEEKMGGVATTTRKLTPEEIKIREEELRKMSEMPSPWSLMDKEQHRNPVLRLHEEVWAFAEHYLLTPKGTRMEAGKMAKNIADEVEACLRADQPSTTSSKKWASVRPCGLYSLGEFVDEIFAVRKRRIFGYL
ncbi:hypothetical protein Pmar_PMAR007443 [Perkinsus marinus ATCC 50983]|uniref:Uncharacterized protein n=1 Tax=Perkinsus marinus (strain ATCC 50983 / TXsc) TaxID=423536 RepID=C5L979_PERM5|nr:hypothetical protein Pmar_PMAR007443 [Perkinsus marinus ATCC 50983]EER06727.1 hypothetical protein Pmar_PMAR007443 [Perkinsus marinus ATCC 50983]|eukprot:XP_002774911.1 hypothetical protein Pmar_PMAR007443 [Perkinsus marinus ATCC 50983]